METLKKAQSEECIERDKRKFSEIGDNPEYDDGIREDITNRIKRLNDDLKVRQKASISLRTD